MLRSIGAWVLAAVLALLSSSAFRQAASEFRDTEPGSLLFGALQLVIGTSAVMGAVGLLTRASWASRAIGVYGVAAAALLVAQPLYEPMTSSATWSIWLSAALVGAAAAAVGRFARRLAKAPAEPVASVHEARGAEESPAQLPAADGPAHSVRAPLREADGLRVARSQAGDAGSLAQRSPLQE